MPPREWDAATYDRVAAPQETWGRDVLERLDLRGDERVLDAGCGTGRVTALLLERVPDGHVVAVDGSQAMVDETRRRFGDRVEAFAVDLLDLELDDPVDAILSTATFHWIKDHDRLFARLHAALKPGGRLVAQCGGAGNVANVTRGDRARPPSGARRLAGPVELRRRPRDGGAPAGRRLHATSGRGCSPGRSSPRTRGRSSPRRSSGRTWTVCRTPIASRSSTP